MSSGHNANRGRNGSNNSGGGSNGGNNRRARRTLSHQRNLQNQSVLQHRTEASPTSAPDEVSPSLEPEGLSPFYEEKSDRPIREMESLVGSSTPILEASDNPAAPVSERREPGGTASRPEASSGQLRNNRRTPQLIPSASTSQAPVERGPSLHSIRAPFAPGQNHVHAAGNLRSQVPASGADAPHAGPLDAFDLSARQGEGKGPLEDQPPKSEAGVRLSPPLHNSEMPTWRSSGSQLADDDTGDLSPRRVVPGRSEHSSRDERPIAWSRQEQGTPESISFEGRDVRGDIGELIDSLHELFERDRGIASQSDTSRCGICYLHFSLSELQYREEEGFYVCSSCERALAHTRIVMVRRQQHS